MHRLVAVTLVLLAASSRAESNLFNLRASPGVLLSSAGVAVDVDLGADWQFTRGVALDVRVGSMIQFAGFGPGFALNPAVGMRFRLLDDAQGYANDSGGNVAGHLAIAPHLGLYLGLGGPALTVDAEVTYLFSVARPVQVGPFVRPIVAFGPGGVFGGATLGVTVNFGLGPEYGHDRDADGVDDVQDRCPDSPPGAEVDGRGCSVIRHQMVLDGIQFRLNSADIEPSSEQTLQRALASLRDNPHARVEVAGHTDDTGTVERNEVLSGDRARAVTSWLVSHGIDAGRLVAKGYGATRPKVQNTGEVARAVNRRIEFVRLDE